VGAIFSAPVQTGSEAHPAFYWVFLGVRRPGHGVENPLLFCAEFKERVELYLYSPLGQGAALAHSVPAKFETAGLGCRSIDTDECRSIKQ